MRSDRYQIYTHKDSYGEWSLYNIWDVVDSEEIKIETSSYYHPGYTRDRSYAQKICDQINEIYRQSGNIEKFI